MNAKYHLIGAVLVITLAMKASASPPTPAEVATDFLRHLEKSEVDDAQKLCSDKVPNDRVKERIQEMSAKIVACGGIKKLETPPVEQRPRNLQSHEVVVVVVYGNKNLAFGSVSFVEENGQFRISDIRSEKAWGGTTSLFDDND
jgi:hypothetical protein